MGEAIDAALRESRPDDARNDNDKYHTVSAELADVAFMLLSAMPAFPDRFTIPVVSKGLPGINYNVALAYCYHTSGGELGNMNALYMIADELGETFLPLLSSRLARIEAKRKPAEVNA